MSIAVAVATNEYLLAFSPLFHAFLPNAYALNWSLANKNTQCRYRKSQGINGAAANCSN